ncbi:MAG: hypothetical protein V4727_12630 [Verrucomicrobiota bacterium]
MKAETLTKKDIARILVRLLGVYFAYLAVCRIGAIPYILYIFSVMGSEIDFSEKINLATLGPQVFTFLFYAALSFYCIKKGSWLIELISRSESAETKHDAEVDDECGTVKKFD